MKLGLFSDVHEDIESLEKGLAILDKAMCTHLICLGDITGFSNKYYPYESTKDANSCINLIRKNCSVVISGNHDLFSAKKTSQFRAGIQYPENWFELNIEERKKMLPKEIWLYEDEIFPDLSPENIEYLSALPEYHIMKTATHKILFSHFLYPDISGSLRKKIDDIDDYKNHFNFMLEN